MVLTQPDSVAWLFNLRGFDVPHTPVVPAYAILPAKGKAELFIAPEKLTEEVKTHLKQDRHHPCAQGDRRRAEGAGQGEGHAC